MPYLRAFLYAAITAVVVGLSLAFGDYPLPDSIYKMATICFVQTFVGYYFGYRVEADVKKNAYKRKLFREAYSGKYGPPVVNIDVPDVHPWSKPDDTKDTYALVAIDPKTSNLVQRMRGIQEADLGRTNHYLREKCKRRGHPVVLMVITRESKT